jgi:hypothetical protein
MWASLLLVVLAAAAPLEEDERFVEARRHFDDFDLVGAKARFELVLLRDDLEAEERARVYLWIGLCEAENGRIEQAEVAFEEAAAWAPKIKALGNMSPKVREMLEVARERAKDRPSPAQPVEPHDGLHRPDGPGEFVPGSGDEKAEAPKPATPAPPPPARASPLRPWLFAAGGVSTLAAVAAGVGGGALLVVAQGTLSEAEGMSGTDADLKRADGDTQMIGAVSLLAASGALALLGAGTLAGAFLVE